MFGNYSFNNKKLPVVFKVQFQSGFVMNNFVKQDNDIYFLSLWK